MSSIPDPFLGFNELAVEWVAEKDWTYRVRLPKIEHLCRGAVVALAFDGLDTFATATLNGEQILKSDNMFLSHRVDVSHILLTQSPGTDNVLEIEFESALLKARQIQKDHPDHRWVCFNGEPARMAVRKAQYHWGWDWGPVLNTCGPWLPVRLEVYQGRIEELSADVSLAPNYSQAKVDVQVRADMVEGLTGASVNIKLELSEQLIVQTGFDLDMNGNGHTSLNLTNPELWYPHGHGSQPLYRLTAQLSANGVMLDTSIKSIGVRDAKVIQEEDKYGKSFYFRINGIDIFCGGSDWIPADNFTTRISETKYRRWLELLVDGNQNMVRVWGGGIWEPTIFYQICDELGIMVWQDFMFGCGNYPCFPKLLSSIKQEAKSQLRRLRHHPSIVIYAGNNEDYQVQEQNGLTYNYEDKDPDNWLKTDFPARYIYEKILPEAVAKYSPHVQYHPGSPWGDGKITSDKAVGDMHQWNVWHGTQEKYQIFNQLGGRFNSEFGMEAFPHIQTIKAFVGDSVSQLYPQSHMLDFHNKADGHERRIATYLVENFRTRTDLEGYIHLTQLVQSEALMYAYRGWRKQFGDRQCGGALCWQLNDCWPVASWSIVDYYLRKKPAYYAMARVLSPIAVAVQRAHDDWSVVHARPPPSSAWDVWTVNSKTESVNAIVELQFISVSSGQQIKASETHKIKMGSCGTTHVTRGIINNKVEEPHVLFARLFVEGKLMARDMDWPQPLKYLTFENRGVRVEFDGCEELRVRADRPVKGFTFEERESVLVSDSAIDIAPGDTQIIRVRNFKKGDEPLSYRWLGSP